MNKGYDQETGLYKTRYYAKKDAKYNEVAVKVCGGYRLMDWHYYIFVWKKQK